MNRILFVKPADRFLENEFVFQQLGPHYLQSYLQENGIESDLLVLHEPQEVRDKRKRGEATDVTLNQLAGVLSDPKGSRDIDFSPDMFREYTHVAVSTMSPQAPEAYLISQHINDKLPEVTTIIGGQHPRYYQKRVSQLPLDVAFDFIIPQDGWGPILSIAMGITTRNGKNIVISDQARKLTNYPAPTRPLALMEKYDFRIAGIPAFHTVSALGCPFTCHFCESGRESVRHFSDEMLNTDLETIANAHRELGRDSYAVMFFDDVGLMNPNQVGKIARLVHNNGFTTWRAFTHAYLVVRYKDKLLNPFHETGGRRIGMGLETGSQRVLDMINKRNGKKQSIDEHYDAVKVANELGIGVDAFTMIYPWEDESDLADTTKMIEFIINNPVLGEDELGRPIKNSVDSTIMTPYQGTVFNDMLKLGTIPGVEMKPDLDPGLLYYKGIDGGSGWPYLKTRLPRERYEEEQAYRHSLRPEYR